MSDPVAEKSAFLRKYMSGHPDTLVAYAKWFGKVQEPITSAEMKSIDTKVIRRLSGVPSITNSSKSMTLLCSLKNGTKKEVYVPIEPPLKGYADVKPRLLDMKATAQEKLGMIKIPRITSFRFPPDAFGAGFFVGAVLYLFFTPIDGRSAWYEPARLVHSMIGSTPVTWTTYILGVTHLLETVYTYTLCRKHTSFITGVAYLLATMFCGFPIWKDLRSRIQIARIDSVMKVQ
ncbi:hypothetical protein C0993_006548 [Termitomyces sp. T159_Od127]|nr:hypothetical protein C0993_006548 [Termitomyces sp. T159_Od127]